MIAARTTLSIALGLLFGLATTIVQAQPGDAPVDAGAADDPDVNCANAACGDGICQPECGECIGGNRCDECGGQNAERCVPFECAHLCDIDPETPACDCGAALPGGGDLPDPPDAGPPDPAADGGQGAPVDPDPDACEAIVNLLDCVACCLADGPRGEPARVEECRQRCAPGLVLDAEVAVDPGLDADVFPDPDLDFGPPDPGPDAGAPDPAPGLDFGPPDAEPNGGGEDCQALPPEECPVCCMIEFEFIDEAAWQRCMDACGAAEAGVDADLDAGLMDDAGDAGIGPDAGDVGMGPDAEDPDGGGVPHDMFVDALPNDALVNMPDMDPAQCNAEELLGAGATAEDVCDDRVGDRNGDFCSDQEPSVPVVDEEDYSFGPNIDCRGLYRKIPRFIRRYLPKWMRLQGSLKLQLRMQTVITQEGPDCPDCLASDEAQVRNDLSFDLCGVLDKKIPFNELTGQANMRVDRQHRLECDPDDDCQLQCGGVDCTTNTDTVLVRIRRDKRPSKFLGFKDSVTFLGYGVEWDCGARLRFDAELSGSRAKSSGRNCPDCEHLEANFGASTRADVPCRLSIKGPGGRVNLGCRRCARVGLTVGGHSELNEPAICGEQASCGEVFVTAEASIRTECNCIGVGWFQKCLTCSGGVQGRGALGTCQSEFYKATVDPPSCRTCRRP